VAAKNHLLDLKHMAHVKMDRVTIQFPIYTPHTRSVTSMLTGRLGGSMQRNNGTTVVSALKNVSLNLGDGDRLGLVGHNGAGKTTFLRVVAGVYPPVSGSIDVEGRVSAFTDIMLGMNYESNGWDNIIYRCVFLGLSFKEAHALAPSIAEFSELGNYLDVPVRTYSAGMLVRLAFSIATSIKPEILVMDEMLSAGDPQFIHKAMARVGELLDHTKILVLGSQLEAFIKHFCNKAVWLHHGEVRAFGTVNEVWTEYAASSAATLP
jgi:ABC-type polysaccharide/polyol phosphate transport system ATPase subunit